MVNKPEYNTTTATSTHSADTGYVHKHNWQQRSLHSTVLSSSVCILYDCIGPLVANSLQSGWFWANHSCSIKGGGILQPRRLRPLNGPIRHPHEYSQLELGAATYGNLRDLLTKLTRSPTSKYRKSFGYKYSFPQVSRLQDAYQSHYPRQMHPCSEPAWLLQSMSVWGSQGHSGPFSSA